MPRSIFAKVENCNLALTTAASALGLASVGIGGKDLADGTPKLVLAFAWRLLHADVTRFLQSVGMRDEDILAWANARLAAAGVVGGATGGMTPLQLAQIYT